MEIINNKKHIDKVIMPFEIPDRSIEAERIADISEKPVYTFFKRMIDIIVSIVGIVVCLIPMAAAYIAVAFTSKGSPIYRQERLGLNGKQFLIYKFRTMYEDAENEGIQWSRGEDDERITPVGKILRRTKFDEVPQLFNCLIGDLSLVGPRPERAVFYECFETYIHGFSQRLLVKPGITGLAQINGGYFLKPEEKIVFDIEYIKTRSLWNDLKIILKTVAVVIRGDGAK